MAGSGDDEWYICSDGSDPIGPIRTALIVRGLEAGKVPFDSQICGVGSDEWVPLVTVEEFANVVRAQAPPPPQMPPPPPRSEPERMWYIASANGRVAGPVLHSAVLDAIAKGIVQPSWRACELGGSAWRGLDQMGDFTNALSEAEDSAKDEAWSDDDDEETVFLDECDRAASPHRDTGPPPPAAPPVYGFVEPTNRWHVAYPGLKATGPHTEAELVHAIATGQVTPSALVRRESEESWNPIYAIPAFSNCWPQHTQQVGLASAGNPPAGHIVFLVLVGAGAALFGILSLNLVWLGLGAIAVIVYIDAWLAGVRRTQGAGGLLDMSPLGWSVSVLLFSALVLPLYVWKRASAATLKGSTLTHVAVIFGALGFAGLFVVVLLRVMFIGPKGLDLSYVREERREDLVVPSVETAPGVERDTAAQSDSKWAMTCPPNTTWHALREQAKRAWKEENKYRYATVTCGDLIVQHHYSRAAGNQLTDKFNLIVYYPHEGNTSSALTKKMVDDLFPNLGDPVRSVGSCKPAAEAVALVSALGPDAVKRFSSTIREQGGYRGAVFESDGIRVAVTPGPWARSRKYPDRVVFYVSDGEREELDPYPPIPWKATAPCSTSSSGR
jgi:GYF domain 2